MITVEHLRATGHLAPFTDADLELLLGATTARTFQAGETLCIQGRSASSCFILLSGVVAVVKEDEGRTRLLTRLPAGTFAGQLALVDRSPRIATLLAETEVTALELTRDVFDRLVASSSPLAYRFQIEIAVATGRQLREADRRLAAVLQTHGRRSTVTPELAIRTSAELATLRHIRDAVGDVDVPFEPIDVVEIIRPERILGTNEPL
ncbi:MAG: cyclic nucleotide-binding domain-containing protein [Deltaproteobacteria bacterium]|nr:cyclic nucleotide-binding domain-containing protein [Deltaproteobacteria bacterium]